MREAKKTGLLYKRPDGRVTRTVLLFGHRSQKKKRRRVGEKASGPILFYGPLTLHTVMNSVHCELLALDLST